MNFKTSIAAATLLALCAVPAFAQQATPRALTVNAVATGGVAVTPISGPTNGCYITNPLTSTDQGIVTAEPLYIDPTTTAGTASQGTTVAIPPGGVWFCVPNSTLPVSANAATTAHKFGGARW